MCLFPFLLPALIFASVLDSTSGVSVSDELYKYDPPFYHTPYAHPDPHYPFLYPEPPPDNHLPEYAVEPPFYPSPHFDPYPPLSDAFPPPDEYEQGFIPVEPAPPIETQTQAPEPDPVAVLEVTTSQPQPEPQATTTQAPSPPVQHYIFIDKRGRGRGRSGRQRTRLRERQEEEYGRDEDDVIRYLVKYQQPTIQAPQPMTEATTTRSTSTTSTPPLLPSPTPTFSVAPNNPQPVSEYRLPVPQFDSHFSHPYSVFYPPPRAHYPHPAPHPHSHPHGFLTPEPVVVHADAGGTPHGEPQHGSVPLRDYSFAYSVNDPHTLDHKSAHESREGGLVQGSYSLLQPDGVLRTVTYSAHPAHGFHAIVSNSHGPVT